MFEINMLSIVGEVQRLKVKPYKTFVNSLMDLLVQIERCVALRGPYRLVLDSNILMRLESLRQGKIAEGLLASLLALLFAKRLPFHMDLVVRPVVFYEFLRQRNVVNLRDHWDEIKALKSLVQDSFGEPLLFDGAETYESAMGYLAAIQHDATAIAETLRNYREMDWHFDFVRPPFAGFSGFPTSDGRIVVPPVLAAEGLYESPSLEYLSPAAVEMFLRQHIERNLVESPHNDKRVIEAYQKDTDFLLTRILKLASKGQLVGLGDVDVFGACNLSWQFNRQSNGRYAPASIALSLDEKLVKALSQNAVLSVHSRQMRGSSDPVEQDGQMAAWDAFMADSERIKEGERRCATVREKLFEFLDELRELGTFREGNASAA